MSVYCQATLNYVDGETGRPVDVPMLNGRDEDPGPSYDEFGFELVPHRSAVTDWGDTRQLHDVHRTEIHSLAVEFSGCDTALVYPPIVRSPEAATAIDDYAPILTVHNDFSEDYRPMIEGEDRVYRHFLDPLLAQHGITREQIRAARRVMMLQFWRNIGSITPDYPLACCDSRSIRPDRIRRAIIPYYGGRRLDFEVSLAAPPDDATSDRWYTFPNMNADEAVALRTYDSERIERGEPFLTMHSAFRDPHVDDDPRHRRESVEMRVLCLWG